MTPRRAAPRGRTARPARDHGLQRSGAAKQDVSPAGPPQGAHSGEAARQGVIGFSLWTLLLALPLAACASDPGKIPGCRTDADCTGGQVCIARTGVCERFNRPLEIDASLRDASRTDAAIRMDAPRRDAARGDAGPTDARRGDAAAADAARLDARPRG